MTVFFRNAANLAQLPPTDVPVPLLLRIVSTICTAPKNLNLSMEEQEMFEKTLAFLL
jgi:hypothetical protein